ncbi:MAG: YIP1 family protein [Anaerolineae bacterium]|nr:YIP1 family protein [Caldilineales bacterium]MCX7852975.1 YIP1 family protein [Caldilineales bacterium]MDW8268569.1 YIP1 family protein [Anaerolineae bacterium]
MNAAPAVPSSPLRAGLRLALDALTLKPEPYRRLAAEPSLRRAVAIVLAVGLLLGLVQALVALPGLVRDPAAEVEAALAGFREGLDSARTGMADQMTPELAAIFDLLDQSIEAFRPYFLRLVAVPAPLPSFVGRFSGWLGDWLSQPFALLAKWLGISIWILLFARLLGGRGGLLPYLAASSLSVIPHLLAAFGPIPCLGDLLTAVGSIWGLVIQYKAVETTQNLSSGRAVAAVLLPYVLFLVVGVLVAVFGVFILASLMASA